MADACECRSLGPRQGNDPCQAYIHSRPQAEDHRLSDTEDLPALDVTKLRLSIAEVQSVIVLPIPGLEFITDTSEPLSIIRQMFRERVPYDVVDVSRIPMVSLSDSSSSEWTSPTGDRVEIWGLTGWILDVMLRRFGVWPMNKNVSSRSRL